MFFWDNTLTLASLTAIICASKSKHLHLYFQRASLFISGLKIWAVHGSKTLKALKYTENTLVQGIKLIRRKMIEQINAVAAESLVMIGAVFEEQSTIVRNDMKDLEAINDRMAEVFPKIKDLPGNVTHAASLKRKNEMLSAKDDLEVIESLLEKCRLLKRNVRMKFYISEEVDEIQKKLTTLGELCVEDLNKPNSSKQPVGRPFSLKLGRIPSVKDAARIGKEARSEQEEELDMSLFAVRCKYETKADNEYCQVDLLSDNKPGPSPPPPPARPDTDTWPTLPMRKKTMVYYRKESLDDGVVKGRMNTTGSKAGASTQQQLSSGVISNMHGQNGATVTGYGNGDFDFDCLGKSTDVVGTSDITNTVALRRKNIDRPDTKENTDSGFWSGSRSVTGDDDNTLYVQSEEYARGSSNGEKAGFRPVPRPRRSLQVRRNTEPELPRIRESDSCMPTTPAPTRCRSYIFEHTPMEECYNATAKAVGDGLERSTFQYKPYITPCQPTFTSCPLETTCTDSSSTDRHQMAELSLTNSCTPKGITCTSKPESHSIPNNSGSTKAMSDCPVSFITGLCILDPFFIVLANSAGDCVQLATADEGVIDEKHTEEPFGCCHIGNNLVAVSSKARKSVQVFKVDAGKLHYQNEISLPACQDGKLYDISYSLKFFAVACMTRVLVLNENFTVYKAIQPVTPGKKTWFYQKVLFSKIQATESGGLMVFASDCKKGMVSCTDAETEVVNWSVHLDQPSGLAVEKEMVVVASKMRITVLKQQNGQLLMEYRSNIPKKPLALALKDGKIYLSRKAKTALESRSVRVIKVQSVIR